MQFKNFLKKGILFIFLFLISAFFAYENYTKTSAQSVDELQEQIQERRDLQERLKKEADEAREQLQRVSAEKNTLQNTVNSLTSTVNKLSSDIRSTENQIDTSNLTLQKLDIEITDKSKQIDLNNDVLSRAIKKVDELESLSLIERLVAYENLSEFFNTLHNLEKFNSDIKNTLVDLKELNIELQEKQDETEEEKTKLESLIGELAGEKEAIDYTKKEKERVLAVTKNKESEYQKLVQEKEAARAQIESELSELEAKLQYTLDPSKLPSKGSGVLAYPVSNPTVTQGYGLTPFARSGAYGYDSNGQPKPHRAIDLKAPIGTKIYSSANGVVRQSYNMDSIPGCRSYGQWVLVDHDNGLSTLYTHLSSRLVSAGDPVDRGELIALSGQSGYSVGPHLHFGVFPRDGVEVQKFTTSIGCKNALIPLAAKNAYLNPFDYLK